MPVKECKIYAFTQRVWPWSRDNLYCAMHAVTRGLGSNIQATAFDVKLGALGHILIRIHKG